jgi:serine/threonine-protein kinase
MADVYLAYPIGGGEPVAVKLLNERRAREPDSCALFLDEARLASVLDHPNIARVYEAGASDGVHYLAMEFVNGADVREILACSLRGAKPLAYDSALTIVANAAAGLEHAHRVCAADGRPLQLVHRDVSLSNIMVGHDGAVKVIDFGVARSRASLHITKPGVVRGKAQYMSPEQCLGAALDCRTDVFALGVVLYELTTGDRCFAGNSDQERMCSVIRGEWTRPTALIADYPSVLEQVLSTALAFDPAERFPSAAALIDAIEAVALLEGWALGRAATQRMMRELCDERVTSGSRSSEAARDLDEVIHCSGGQLAVTT